MTGLGARPAALLAAGLAGGWLVAIPTSRIPDAAVLHVLAAALLAAGAWKLRRSDLGWLAAGMAVVLGLAAFADAVAPGRQAPWIVALAAAIPTALALVRAPPLVWVVPLPLLLSCVAFALRDAPPWLHPWAGAVVVATLAAYLGLWAWRAPAIRRWAWFGLAAFPLALVAERVGYEATVAGLLVAVLGVTVALRRRNAAQPVPA